MPTLKTALLLGSTTLLFALAANADPGKDAYEENCAECHGVASADVKSTGSTKASDLGGALQKGGAAWIIQRVGPGRVVKSHTKPFKGSDEELQVLVDWLLEQKAEE